MTFPLHDSIAVRSVRESVLAEATHEYECSPLACRHNLARQITPYCYATVLALSAGEGGC